MSPTEKHTIFGILPYPNSSMENSNSDLAKALRKGMIFILVGAGVGTVVAIGQGQIFLAISLGLIGVGALRVTNAIPSERSDVPDVAPAYEPPKEDAGAWSLGKVEQEQKREQVLPPEPAPPPPPPEPPKPPPVKKDPINWEEWVGQKLLQKLGILIVLIGMAVFLKYSFDNGWIGPHGRIMMSALSACLLLGAGEFFQKKYPQWFQAFTGGGMALLYFTVWAAHVFYAGKLAFTVTPLMATILYGMITLVGALAAIRYKAQVIAWFTVLGGYATPMLIEGVSNPMGFVTFLAILAAGLIILAWHQKWRYLNAAAFIFTQAYLWSKIYPLSSDIFTDPQQIIVAVGFFLLFGLLPFIYQFRVGTPTEPDDILITIGNGLAVLVPVIDAFGGIQSQYLTFILMALAAVYVGYAALALQKVSKDDKLINTYLVGAVILIAIALFVELEKEWVSVGWAPFSALLVFMAARLQRTGPWICSIILLAGSVFFLAIQTPGIAPNNPEMLWQPFTSAWSLQSYVLFASLLFWIRMSGKLPSKILSAESMPSARGILHTVFAVLLFVFIALNAFAFGVPAIDWTIDMVLMIGLILFTTIAVGAFLFTGVLVWFVVACIVQVLTLASVFLFAQGSGMCVYCVDSAILPFLHPWAGVSAAALLLTAAMITVALTRSDKRINTPQVHALFIGVALAQVFVHFSVEIYHLSQYFDWSTIVFSRVLGGWWIFFAIALHQYGVIRNKSIVADVGMYLLAIPLLKDAGVLFSGLTDMYEVIQWTVIPLGMSIMEKRQGKHVGKFLILALGVFAILDMIKFVDTNFIHTIWWTGAAFISMIIGTRRSMESLVIGGCLVLVGVAAIDIFSHISADMMGFWRTSWWAIAALATISVGFSEKRQLLRKVGIGMFFAAAIKLLVFDFATLTTGVRIAASIITGLMMIGASYLYQRFGSSSPTPS